MKECNGCRRKKQDIEFIFGANKVSEFCSRCLIEKSPILYKRIIKKLDANKNKTAMLYKAFRCYARILTQKPRLKTGNGRWPEYRTDKSTYKRAVAFRNAEGSHSKKEIYALFKKQKNKCAYCEKDLRIAVHKDHILPISRGGSKNIDNIQLLCPTCNLTKNDMTHEEFIQFMGRYLPLVKSSGAKAA